MLDPYFWRRRCVLLIYNLLLPLGLLVLLPGSLLKMRRRGGYGQNFRQRLGFFSKEVRQRLAEGCAPFWLHAVSVGEVGVARKLIKEILRREPERRIVLSTTTSTGHAVAVKDAPDQVTVIYSPVDFLPIVGRVLKLVRPEVLVFVEAEVWPNLACLAKRRGVRLVLANARLSPRSARRYARAKWWVQPVFSLLDHVLVQFPESLKPWREIGAQEKALVLTGSVKYDEPAAKPGRAEEFRGIVRTLWCAPGTQLILGASTFPQEESMLGKLLLKLRADFPLLKLILVPRHVERSKVVQAEMESLGLQVALRSTMPVGPADVLIVDTTGELRDWQQLPDVVVIGKSFFAKGGQNPVEALAAGTPVITGPEMSNFPSLMKLLLEADGLRQVPDAGVLETALVQTLRAPSEARAAAQRGLAALTPHRGAAKRSAALICEREPSDASQ